MSRATQHLCHDADNMARSPRGFFDSSEVKAADTCMGPACGCLPAPLRGEAVAFAGSQAHSPAQLVQMVITGVLRLTFSWPSLQKRRCIRHGSQVPPAAFTGAAAVLHCA